MTLSSLIRDEYVSDEDTDPSHPTVLNDEPLALDPDPQPQPTAPRPRRRAGRPRRLIEEI
jgi:hypothetical protein